ncbi:unnamed protein product [Amaranthus hypochondriacus]
MLNYKSLLLFIACYITLSNHLVVESCNAIDKEALLDFKARIILDREQRLSTWVSNTNCCTSWKGIRCNPNNGRVVSIIISSSLSELFMAGTLSPYLGNITYLEVLDLSIQGMISGPIPTQLGQLSHLTKLDLSLNQFSGSIPTQLGHLSQLTHLHLSSN